MRPNEAGEVMSRLGLAQLGWFSTSVAVISVRNFACSVSAKLLARPESRSIDPGPMITPLAQLPKDPFVGAENALVSNHLVSERWSEARFALNRQLGRRV